LSKSIKVVEAKRVPSTKSIKGSSTAKTSKASKPKKVVTKEENLEAKKGKSIKGRSILGYQLNDNISSEVTLTVNVLLKSKTPLSLGRIVEEIKQIKFSQGTPKDCKFSNLETRVRRSLNNTIEIATNRSSKQSKQFSIEVNYTNLKVVEENGLYSLSLRGKAPNVRPQLDAKK
jgi:pyruvate carboxylase